MTPSQQMALETLAGRSLTSTEIEYALSRNDTDLATSLSVGLTKTVPTKIGIGAVLATLGAVSGAAILDTLTTVSGSNRPLYWALQMLSREQLDMSDPNVSAQMALLVTAGILTQAQSTSLLNLAIQPAPISTGQVSTLLNGV